MTGILWQTLCLAVAAAINYALGLTDTLGVKKFEFDARTFITGAVKALIICGSLIGIGFIWTYSGVDLSALGYTPSAILTAGICYYGFKVARRFISMWIDKKEDTVIASDVEEAEEDDE